MDESIEPQLSKLARFIRSRAEITRMFDERFARTWELYRAPAIATFRVGSHQRFQVSFARAPGNSIPWTRVGLYH